MRPLAGCIILLVFFVFSLAKIQEPLIFSSTFSSAPTNLFYFDIVTAIFTEKNSGVVYRSVDAGQKWKVIKELEEVEIQVVISHPINKSVAIAIGREKKHWITENRGKSWRQFTIDESLFISPALNPIIFHAIDDRKMLFHTRQCTLFDCHSKSWYTTDKFRTIHLLRSDAQSCIWAKSRKEFVTSDDNSDLNGIVCIVSGKYSQYREDNRLVISNDYFKNEFEPDLAGGRAVSGVTRIAPVTAYIVVAAKSEGTSELAFYVTKDFKTWQRAHFGQHQIEEDAYTLLESTEYSLQVDVLTSRFSNPIGVLFTSNSDGTYFKKNVAHTNRNEDGIVDFEQVSNIRGVVLVNLVQNWETVQDKWNEKRKLKSSISFDDGRSFSPLLAGDVHLHLHSVTEIHNIGRLFSSPAPGLMMGIGNTGEILGDYNDGDLYVSDDAGVNWKLARKRPHLYEFGRWGTLLVAIAEGIETDELAWSTNYGQTWRITTLNLKVQPLVLTTFSDSSSSKFLIIGTTSNESSKYVVVGVDFENLAQRKCTESDFETWYPKESKSGRPICVMGQQQPHRRRKLDSDCRVATDIQQPTLNVIPCDCTDQDYECDVGFVPTGDDGSCEPISKLIPTEGQCKSTEDFFLGSSGYRLIPGNVCTKKNKNNKDSPIERSCKETYNEPHLSNITAATKLFEGQKCKRFFYLERKDSGQSQGTDESIIFLTEKGRAYKSHDHGKTWELAVEDEILDIYENPHFSEDAYLITPTNKIYYSRDHGRNIHSFIVPSPPSKNHHRTLDFHPRFKDWLIWLGGKGCGGGSDQDCHTVAYVTTKGGEQWEPLLSYVDKCEFMMNERRNSNEKLVFCSQFESENVHSNLKLISSTDFFEIEKNNLFDSILEFAQQSEFIIVATKAAKDLPFLHCSTSLDGDVFAEAKFPPDFMEPRETGYNALDSSTHSIFLHITLEGEAYGSIVKSNSNGTSYVLSIRHINKNEAGYVDFEKIKSLEGIAISNIVDNPDEFTGGSVTDKRIKTRITYNDGADWVAVIPPSKDLNGHNYDCGTVLENCSLHLHGFTERRDLRNTYYSPTAVGLVIGVGNVGKYLSSYNDGDTFMSTDGGMSWKIIMKGTFKWAYGDQGSIIVLVDDSKPTNVVHYSLDEGQRWETYKFNDSDLEISEITNLPSGTSRKFLLWGKDPAKSSSMITVNLDFTGVYNERCYVNLSNPGGGDDDYYLWTPEHPRHPHQANDGNNCLFGHVAKYLRKKPRKNCYNGRSFIAPRLQNITRNCECTRRDYECDYNFVRNADGVCTLVPGHEPPDPILQCKENPLAIEYNEPTGYRRIPTTTCEGGSEKDKASISHPCPGYEDEFRKKRAISMVRLLLSITIPFALAGAIGLYVWRNWDGKLGRIQLGETSYDYNNLWMKWPIVVRSKSRNILASVSSLFSYTLGSALSFVDFKFNSSFMGRNSYTHDRGVYTAINTEDR